MLTCRQHGLGLDRDDDPMVQVGSNLPPNQPISTIFPSATAVISRGHSPSTLVTSHVDEFSAKAGAPQKPTKPLKKLLVDRVTELTNRELSEWNSNYIENMVQATQHKERQKSLAVARAQARFWFIEQGIGGVATEMQRDGPPHPLAFFCGQNLLDSLTGTKPSATGKKRPRSASSTETADEAVRHRRMKDDNSNAIPGDEQSLDAHGADKDIAEQGDDESVSFFHI